jgi:hypothetical protein
LRLGHVFRIKRVDGVGDYTFVRIHSIELDPETPSFPGEEWHTEGNANERIVAN